MPQFFLRQGRGMQLLYRAGLSTQSRTAFHRGFPTGQGRCRNLCTGLTREQQRLTRAGPKGGELRGYGQGIEEENLVQSYLSLDRDLDSWYMRGLGLFNTCQ